MVFLISKLSLHSKGWLLCLYVANCISDWLYNFFWCSGAVVDQNRLILHFQISVVVICFNHCFSYISPWDFCSICDCCNIHDHGVTDRNGFLVLNCYYVLRASYSIDSINFSFLFSPLLFSVTCCTFFYQKPTEHALRLPRTVIRSAVPLALRGPYLL